MSNAVLNGLAGAGGGIVAQIITYPLQTVNTRQQTERVAKKGIAGADNTPPSSSSRGGTLVQLLHVIRTEGWGGLYSGLKPSLFGTAASQGIYYYFYQVFKNKAEAIAAARKRKGLGDGTVGMFSWLVVAAIAGSLNVLFTNPIWVLVTRMQTQTQAEKKIMEGKREAILKEASDSCLFPISSDSQRDRAAWLCRGKDSFVDSVAENLLDRLADCKKTFPTALCLGGSLLAIRRLLQGRGAIENLIMMDMSYDMVQKCRDCEKNMPDSHIETSFVVGDEEYLPIKESSLDLVISCLGLHWTNDLPGAMIQCRLGLKPDGLLLAAILGGETLKELRIACTIAHMEREGGISPRISPLAQVRDAGNLLTRAGFTLPSVDVDEYTVRYESAFELIEHLRSMGETSALFQRNKILKKETALAAAAVYQSMFAAEDGTVPATFQVIYMTGWREHPSQQKAKRRGSATVSFKDIQQQFGTNSVPSSTPNEENGPDKK